jgi:hypothetical protein
MQPSSITQRIRYFRHWETWAGMLLCGLCGGTGAYLGEAYLGRAAIVGGGIGGGIGGLLFVAIVRYVIRRYYKNPE